MRILTLILLSTTLLGACSLVGRGANPVPAGDAWRTQVVAAIAETPGVTSTEISVHDVDSGTGYTGRGLCRLGAIVVVIRHHR